MDSGNENIFLYGVSIVYKKNTVGTVKNYLYTLPGRKYLFTTKYPSTDCAIYRLNIQLEPKMGIETCRSQKFVVLA